VDVAPDGQILAEGGGIPGQSGERNALSGGALLTGNLGRYLSAA